MHPQPWAPKRTVRRADCAAIAPSVTQVAQDRGVSGQAPSARRVLGNGQRAPGKTAECEAAESTIVLHPHGHIVIQQADLIVTSTLLLLIVVPPLVLTLVFA